MKVKITDIRESKSNPKYHILRVEELGNEDSDDFFTATSKGKSANHPISTEIKDRFKVGQVLNGARIETQASEEPLFEGHEAFSDGLYYINRVVKA